MFRNAVSNETLCTNTEVTLFYVDSFPRHANLTQKNLHQSYSYFFKKMHFWPGSSSHDLFLLLSAFTTTGTQQSDTKRQHLLERLLDAVKQVGHPDDPSVLRDVVPHIIYKDTCLCTVLSSFLPTKTCQKWGSQKRYSPLYRFILCWISCKTVVHVRLQNWYSYSI